MLALSCSTDELYLVGYQSFRITVGLTWPSQFDVSESKIRLRPVHLYSDAPPVLLESRDL